MNRAAMRVLAPNANMSTAYCKMPLDPDEPDLQLSDTFVLHPTTVVPNLPDEGDRQAVRTITFAEGLELDFTPQDYFGFPYANLASTKIAPDANGLCFVDSSNNLEALFAFSPEGDVRGKFPMRVSNSTGLAPNTVVDLYILGGLNCTLEDGTHLEEADWHQYGTGTVSADGTTIDAEEAGLPCLTWFGYAAR